MRKILPKKSLRVTLIFVVPSDTGEITSLSETVATLESSLLYKIREDFYLKE